MKLCLHQPVFYFENRLPAAGKLKVLSLKFIVYSKDLTTPQAQTEKLLVLPIDYAPIRSITGLGHRIHELSKGIP